MEVEEEPDAVVLVLQQVGGQEEPLLRLRLEPEPELVLELELELEPEPEPELEPGLEVPGPEGLLLYPHPSILHNYGLPIPCCLRHHFHTFCGLC